MPANAVSEVREAARPEGQRDATVVPYDFRRPSQLSREHTRLLQMAYETFARRMTTLLTSGLRQVCQVSVAEIAQQSYEEYISGLELLTMMTPMTIPPLAGTGVLEFSLPVALAAIDHMLGGPGGAQTARPLTDIETSLIRGLLDQMRATLCYALEPVLAINPTLGEIEYNPQFVQAAGATDAVMVASFDMVVGRESCTLTICLPLAPLLPKLTAQRARERADAEAELAAADTARRLRARLGDVPLDVSVRFTSVGLSPSRILSLVEGDILPLSHRVGQPLAVEAGGITFARAVAGKSGKRLAALVVETPEELA